MKNRSRSPTARSQAKARIPGFRPGKAPRQVVERMIGREGLIREALDSLVPDVYNDAIDEHDVDAIDQPDLEIVDLEPVRFKATVPVRPTIDLGAYTEVRVEQPEVGIRRRRSRTPGPSPPPRTRHLRSGRTWRRSGTTRSSPASLDAWRLMHPKLATSLQTASPATMTTLPKSPQTKSRNRSRSSRTMQPNSRCARAKTLLVPGLAEAFLGMTAGESKEFEVDVPEDHRVTQLSGKKASLLSDRRAKSRKSNSPNGRRVRQHGQSAVRDIRAAPDDIARQLRERARPGVEVDFRNKAIDAAPRSGDNRIPRGDGRSRDRQRNP